LRIRGAALQQRKLQEKGGTEQDVYETRHVVL